MTIGILATIAYGALAIVGGIIGYTKVGSRPSLLSGSISGILLFVSAALQYQGMAWAKIMAIAIIAILVITFIVRFQKTRKWMPAGMMVILGIIALAIMAT